jgi:hypothetical protein
VSARRLRARSWIGLAFAVVSSGLLTVFLLIGAAQDGSLGGLWLLCITLGPLLSGAAGTFAALAVLGPVKTPIWYRISVPVLATAAALAGCYLGLWLVASLVWPVVEEAALYANGDPYDWTPVIVSIIGAVLYLTAATLYGFAGTRQGVPVGARTGLLVLLLLAMVPFANILGLVGLTIVTYARTSPNGHFLRLRGGSTRQY